MKMEQSIPKRRHIKFRPRRKPKTFRTLQKFEIKFCYLTEDMNMKVLAQKCV
jgi:hypothetical protein